MFKWMLVLGLVFRVKVNDREEFGFKIVVLRGDVWLRFKI